MKKSKKDAVKQKSTGKKLTQKAGFAVKNKFYLEASWILSSMMEKKLKKLLEKIEKQQPGKGFTFEQSIKRVKFLHLTSKNPLLSAHLSVVLIDEIRNWKNQRNTILNDMQDVHVSEARLERLATEGIRLFKELNKANKSFNPDSRNS